MLGSTMPSLSGGATHGGGTTGEGKSGMAVGKIGAGRGAGVGFSP
jgi:hypothetical protein